MAAKEATMMIDQCARLLFQARTRGFRLYDIPSVCRPKDVETAYEIQSRLSQLLQAKKIGYKIANTNETSQQFLKLPEPFFGPLLQSNQVGIVGTKQAPVVVKQMSKLSLRLCEPEFAFLIGENKTIVAAAPAIEIVHSSFLDWKTVGAPSLIADLACNGAWIRGDPVPIEQVQLGGCTMKVNGKEFAKGFASRVYGSPFKAFEKICEQKFVKLQPGDWVTTGVCVDPPYHYCQVGDHIEAQFDGGLGTVAITCER